MTSHHAFLTLPLAASLLALGACSSDEQRSHTPPDRFAAEIRRTSHGIPHIKAADDAGLGFGVAYAYAQDNVCLLACRSARTRSRPTRGIRR